MPRRHRDDCLPSPRDGATIAYVTSGYPWVSHTFILNEVLELRRRGLRIATFTVRRTAPGTLTTDRERQERDSTYAFRPVRLGDYVRAHGRALATGRYAHTLATALRLRRRARREVWRSFAHFAQAVVFWDQCRTSGITHAHAHFANVSSDIAMLAAAISAGDLSWSFTMHGPTEFYEVSGHTLAEKVHAATAVVCISDFARSQLMAQVEPSQWPKLRVVHCGVDVDEFAPVPRSSEPERLRILSVGRLVPVKGQALLIEAVARLVGEGTDVVLDLAGDGPDRAMLAALAASLGIEAHVRFHGAVAPPRVRALLSNADIFCLASFAEGVPVALMEAMATQCPVVATAIMGIPELIEDGVSGRLVRPGSDDDLVSALRELIRDPQLRLGLGEAGRRRVVEAFSIRSSGALLATILRSHAT